MEREQSARFDLNPELIQIASDKGESYKIAPTDAQIFTFRDESLPPCIIIEENESDWVQSRVLWIDQVKAVNTLSRLGVVTVEWAMPHENHVDSYTDPDNDSSEAKWTVSILPENVEQLSDPADEFILPEREDPALMALVLGEDEHKIPMRLSNVDLFFYEEDPELSNVTIIEEFGDGMLVPRRFYTAEVPEEFVDHMKACGFNQHFYRYAPDWLKIEAAEDAISTLDDELNAISRQEAEENNGL